MAQHKAPTAVTIAPTGAESGLRDFVQRYWLFGVGAAVVAAGVILFTKYREQQARAAKEGEWEGLSAGLQLDPRSGELAGDAQALARVATEAGSGNAAFWARVLEVRAHVQQRKFAEARQAMASVEQLASGVVGVPNVQASIDDLKRWMEAEASWHVANPGVFANPPPPPDAPKVKINTDKGAIVVQLYPDRAPKHVENFLKLCREKYYDGTRFHRIDANMMIQGGDPLSRGDDANSWGQGGPDTKIDFEDASLHHFAGVLSMAKQPREWQSSGSQFFVTVQPAHHLDGEHVVFGQVVEGLDIAQQIATAELAPDTADRPAVPVVVQSTEVL